MMNWHSQGLIYGAVTMVHLLDTNDGKEISTKIKYKTWQLPLIRINKILRLFNPKEYFDKEKYNPTINKGADENDKK